MNERKNDGRQTERENNRQMEQLRNNRMNELINEWTTDRQIEQQRQIGRTIDRII